MLPIIVQETCGQWTAWFDSQPQASFEGTSVRVAVDGLMRAHGLDPADVRLNYHGIAPGRHIFRIATKVCPDCHGTGRYSGFNTIEDCRECAGAGRL